MNMALRSLSQEEIEIGRNALWDRRGFLNEAEYACERLKSGTSRKEDCGILSRDY